jgi:uroporphyrinogen-III synthase
MAMRILVTRPRADGEETAARLARMGHQALLAPLLETRWFDGPPLDLAGVAAILATSANGVRALVSRTLRRDVPILAVGPQTTQEALAAGFARVENADGDAAVLADAVPRWVKPMEGALLHVCDEQNEGALAERLEENGYSVRREILYVVEPLLMPHEAVAALQGGAVDAALFFSPRSARIFLEQAAAAPLARLTACCISPATAKALPPGLFRDVRIAAKPNQDALLALLD